MVCPLCRTRKARRGCPALRQQICPLCCGTKRRVEIACPETCGWLQASEAHPPAVEQRRRDRDIETVAPMLLSARSQERQAVLAAILEATARHAHAAIPRVIDRDVAEAVEALATTYETSARGIIYDRQPTSLPAQRLLQAYREALTEVTQGQPSGRFEREAGLALRSVSEALGAFAAREDATETAFLDWLQRAPLTREAQSATSRHPTSLIAPGAPSELDSADAPRIIVP